jgi:hypothetical protein
MKARMTTPPTVAPMIKMVLVLELEDWEESSWLSASDADELAATEEVALSEWVVGDALVVEGGEVGWVVLDVFDLLLELCGKLEEAELVLGDAVELGEALWEGLVVGVMVGVVGVADVVGAVGVVDVVVGAAALVVETTTTGVGVLVSVVSCWSTLSLLLAVDWTLVVFDFTEVADGVAVVSATEVVSLVSSCGAGKALTPTSRIVSETKICRSNIMKCDYTTETSSSRWKSKSKRFFINAERPEFRHSVYKECHRNSTKTLQPDKTAQRGTVRKSSTNKWANWDRWNEWKGSAQKSEAKRVKYT